MVFSKDLTDTGPPFPVPLIVVNKYSPSGLTAFHRSRRSERAWDLQ